MNKKLILGIALATAGAAFYFKDKLFPGASSTGTTNTAGGSTTGTVSSGSQHKYEGMVVVAEGNPGWYKIINGKRVVYQEHQAYLSDGSPKLLQISLSELNSIPMDMTRYISVQGFVNERPKL